MLHKRLNLSNSLYIHTKKAQLKQEYFKIKIQKCRQILSQKHFTTLRIARFRAD